VWESPTYRYPRAPQGRRFTSHGPSKKFNPPWHAVTRWRRCLLWIDLPTPRKPAADPLDPRLRTGRCWDDWMGKWGENSGRSLREITINIVCIFLLCHWLILNDVGSRGSYGFFRVSLCSLLWFKQSWKVLMEKEPSEPKNDGHFLDEDVDTMTFHLNAGSSPPIGLLISQVSFLFISASCINQG